VQIDDYYRVLLPSFAVCVPMTEEGAIVTLWQYKHGPKAYSLTFPAGFIEPGEAPEAACRRELLEETGYQAATLRPLGDYVDGGNQPGSHGYYFTATGCAVAQQPADGDLESMELRVMTPAEVDAALDGGQFAIGHHVMAWLLASRLFSQAVG
jgi:ADP-ribose pyrophosphatase